MNVAIVVVTRNHIRDLQECLPSLMAQTFREFAVFLSDNDSTDETVAWVRREYPSNESPPTQFPAVEVIENRANLGFAEGSNIGVRLGLARGATHVVLLNPDTVVDPTWLEELVRSSEADPKIGLCQSKIYRYPATTPPVVNTVGNSLHYTGLGWCGHLDEVDRGQFDQDVEIPYASGAALLIKAEVIREIGLLDANFFMYVEDIDWSVRARLQGHRIVLSARSLAYHRYTFDKSLSKFFFLERNRLLWLLKTYRGWLLLLISPSLLLMECAVLCHAASRGWLRVKLHSYLDVLRMSGHWRQGRRKLQSTRLLSDRCLLPVLSSRLSVPGLEDNLLLRLMNAGLDRYWRLCLRILG